LAFSLDKVDFADRITLPADEKLLAFGAVGSFSFMAGNISDVSEGYTRR
jgi:hypothetical protein